jgi:hypothetical protein
MQRTGILGMGLQHCVVLVHIMFHYLVMYNDDKTEDHSMLSSTGTTLSISLVLSTLGFDTCARTYITVLFSAHLNVIASIAWGHVYLNFSCHAWQYTGATTILLGA